jgi:hypothetical protein
VQAPPSLDDMWDGTARFSLVCAQMKASKIHTHSIFVTIMDFGLSAWRCMVQGHSRLVA